MKCICHSSGGWEVKQGSRPTDLVSGENHLAGSVCHLPASGPPMAEGVRKRSEIYFIRTLIPFTRAPLPTGSPPNTIPVGIRFNTWILEAQEHSVYSIMFIAKPFTIAKIVKQPNTWGPINEFTNCILYIHTMEYCAILFRGGNPVTCFDMDKPWGHYAKWNSQSQKDKHGMVSFIWCIQRIKFLETK